MIEFARLQSWLIINCLGSKEIHSGSYGSFPILSPGLLRLTLLGLLKKSLLLILPINSYF